MIDCPAAGSPDIKTLNSAIKQHKQYLGMWSYSMVLVHMREYLDVLLGFSLPMDVTLSSVLYVDHYFSLLFL